MAKTNPAGGDTGAADGEALTPAGRLLSDAVDQGLRIGVHRPEAFLERFPPDAIMAELADHPRLRAKILVACLHLPQQTAEKLKPEVAGAALETALSAGDVRAADVLGAFDPDDRVRQLPWAALWAFACEGEWWKSHADTSRAFVLAILERARDHGLLDPDAWRDGLTIPRLAKALPRELVEQVLERAASLGATGKPLSGAEIFGIVTPKHLVDSIEVDYLYDRVVVPLARKCHFLRDEPAGADRPSRPPRKAEVPDPEEALWGASEGGAAPGGRKDRVTRPL